MDAFKLLIAEKRWDLALPFVLRGAQFTAEALDPAGAGATAIASAASADEVVLKLRTPNTQGERVRDLQKALAAQGIAVSVDGSFGPATDRAVREFQAKAGLKQDGIVGPATWAVLQAKPRAAAAPASSRAGKRASRAPRARRAR
jgi:peptidoglycan hydrolase-like protein with peptidoglycan-binding domain